MEERFFLGPTDFSFFFVGRLNREWESSRCEHGLVALHALDRKEKDLGVGARARSATRAAAYDPQVSVCECRNRGSVGFGEGAAAGDADENRLFLVRRADVEAKRLLGEARPGAVKHKKTGSLELVGGVTCRGSRSNAHQEVVGDQRGLGCSCACRQQHPVACQHPMGRCCATTSSCSDTAARWDSPRPLRPWPTTTAARALWIGGGGACGNDLICRLIRNSRQASSIPTEVDEHQPHRIALDSHVSGQDDVELLL